MNAPVLTINTQRSRAPRTRPITITLHPDGDVEISDIRAAYGVSTGQLENALRQLKDVRRALEATLIETRAEVDREVAEREAAT
jgi:hypothetical protein